LGRGHIASECPTKIIVILKNNGEYTSESSKVKAMDGDLLMIRRLLENQL